MEDNKYLTEKQASQYFQISERTLDRLRRCKVVKFEGESLRAK